jgi:hypothetical protein
MIKWLIRKFMGNVPQSKSAAARIPADASMAMAVRRFSGEYACGCKVGLSDPTVLYPDECPEHEKPKVFTDWVDHGVQFTERVHVPSSLFRG